MNNIKDGGPAFPLPTVFDEIKGLKYTYETGMSMRDYFAGQALNGLYGLGDGAVLKVILDNAQKDGIENIETAYSILSYKIADAMLKAREVKELI